ncbi:MAG: hypothetical protein GXO86_01450 [Chlorobi bacterium]|nr:hypothetical protein [Chlorobiota bacterium]
MGLRIVRSFLLLLAGLLAVALNQVMTGYAVVFGITLVVSAAFTLVYVFLHFDENINQKVIMEMLTDGFGGLILFTSPNTDQNFVLVVFGFWVFFMGILYLVAGLMEEQNKPFLWAYTLLGIITIVSGFVIINFDLEGETMNTVLYLMGFILIIYSVISLYLLFKRKREIY